MEREKSPQFSYFMTGIGDLTSLKEWAKFGRQLLTTKADSNQASNTEMVKSGLRTVTFMRDCIPTTSPVDKESTYGKMDLFTKVNSKTDFETGRVYGNLGHNLTRETTSTTRKAVKEFITGTMAKLITREHFTKI